MTPRGQSEPSRNRHQADSFEQESFEADRNQLVKGPDRALVISELGGMMPVLVPFSGGASWPEELAEQLPPELSYAQIATFVELLRFSKIRHLEQACGLAERYSQFLPRLSSEQWQDLVYFSSELASDFRNDSQRLEAIRIYAHLLSVASGSGITKFVQEIVAGEKLDTELRDIVLYDLKVLHEVAPILKPAEQLTAVAMMRERWLRKEGSGGLCLPSDALRLRLYTLGYTEQERNAFLPVISKQLRAEPDLAADTSQWVNAIESFLPIMKAARKMYKQQNFSLQPFLEESSNLFDHRVTEVLRRVSQLRACLSDLIEQERRLETVMRLARVTPDGDAHRMADRISTWIADGFRYDWAFPYIAEKPPGEVYAFLTVAECQPDARQSELESLADKDVKKLLNRDGSPSHRLSLLQQASSRLRMYGFDPMRHFEDLTALCYEIAGKRKTPEDLSKDFSAFEEVIAELSERDIDISGGLITLWKAAESRAAGAPKGFLCDVLVEWLEDTENVDDLDLDLLLLTDLLESFDGRIDLFRHALDIGEAEGSYAIFDNIVELPRESTEEVERIENVAEELAGIVPRLELPAVRALASILPEVELNDWIIKIVLAQYSTDDDVRKRAQELLEKIGSHKYHNDPLPVSIRDLGRQDRISEEARQMYREIYETYYRTFEVYMGFGALRFAAQTIPGRERSSLVEFALDMGASVHRLHVTSNDVPPGRGIVISGIQPERAFLVEDPTDPDAFRDYKQAWPWAAEVFDDLRFTRFPIARGAYAVVPPEHERYTNCRTGTHYSMLWFNEHMDNQFRQAGFLVPTTFLLALFEKGLVPEDKRSGELDPELVDLNERMFSVTKFLATAALLNQPIINLGWTSNLGGLCNGYPPRSEFYHAWEVELLKDGDHTIDGAGHVHKSHIMGEYLDTMEDELKQELEPLVEAHNEVYRISRNLFNLHDLMRIARASWTKGLEAPTHEVGEVKLLSEAENLAMQVAESRMLREAYAWNSQLKADVFERDRFPILVAASAHDYWNTPHTPFWLDTMTMKLVVGDRVIQLPLDSDGTGKEELAVWQEHVRPVGLSSSLIEYRFYHRDSLSFVREFYKGNS